MRPSRTELVRMAAGLMTAVVLATGGLLASGKPALAFRQLATATRRPNVVHIVAAGDIACDPLHPAFNNGMGDGKSCMAAATERLIVRSKPDAVLALGDDQYENGTLWEYLHSYALSWGKVRPITYPVPGNHEYNISPTAAGYFAYFHNRPTGAPNGWYSFRLGTWHIIALNSNCHLVGGCDPGSPQYEWLKRDLQRHPSRCALAFMHHPRFFASGTTVDNDHLTPLWQLLYAGGVDVVLGGHRHYYERFARLDADGAADPQKGIREFIVGTGGRLLGTPTTVRPYSQVRHAGTYGVLKLRLRPAGYDWRFLAAAGVPFTDAGTTACST